MGLKFRNLILGKKRKRIILLLINLLAMLPLIRRQRIILTPVSQWEGEKLIPRLGRNNLRDELVWIK